MKVLVLSRNTVIPQHFNADYPAFFFIWKATDQQCGNMETLLIPE